MKRIDGATAQYDWPVDNSNLGYQTNYARSRSIIVRGLSFRPGLVHLVQCPRHADHIGSRNLPLS